MFEINRIIATSPHDVGWSLIYFKCYFLSICLLNGAVRLENILWHLVCSMYLFHKYVNKKDWVNKIINKWGHTGYIRHMYKVWNLYDAYNRISLKPTIYSLSPRMTFPLYPGDAWGCTGTPAVCLWALTRSENIALPSSLKLPAPFFTVILLLRYFMIYDYFILIILPKYLAVYNTHRYRITSVIMSLDNFDLKIIAYLVSSMEDEQLDHRPTGRRCASSVRYSFYNLSFTIFKKYLLIFFIC